MYTIPSQDAISECVITREVVDEPQPADHAVPEGRLGDRQAREQRRRRMAVNSCQMHQEAAETHCRSSRCGTWWSSRHMMAPFVVGRESSILALEATLADHRQADLPRHPEGPQDRRSARATTSTTSASSPPSSRTSSSPTERQGDGRRASARRDRRRRRDATATSPSTCATSTPSYPLTPEVCAVHAEARSRSSSSTRRCRTTSPSKGVMSTLKLDDPDRFADTLASHLLITTAEKQQLLELLNPYERLQKLQDFLESRSRRSTSTSASTPRSRSRWRSAQKEYYLNEKIKAIHQELGRKDDRSRRDRRAPPEDRRSRHAQGDRRRRPMQELKRLEAMPPVSPPRPRSRATTSSGSSPFPGRRRRKEIKDIELAEQILNEDHYGLEKIKERILEFLAVRQLVKQTEGHDPLLRRTSGRRQDLARQVDRPRHRPQVRPPLARRRARRGGDPRPSPHLHRRLPRPDHPADEEGRHDQSGLPPRRGRQDVDGLPRRSLGGAARSARSRSRTTPSPITTSTSSTTSRRSCSSPPPT